MPPCEPWRPMRSCPIGRRNSSQARRRRNGCTSTPSMSVMLGPSVKSGVFIRRALSPKTTLSSESIWKRRAAIGLSGSVP